MLLSTAFTQDEHLASLALRAPNSIGFNESLTVIAGLV
jgi:hypothetical protein